MRQRIATAVIALAALFVVLYLLPPPAAKIVIAGLLLGGAWEWSAFLELSGTLLRIIYVVAIAVLLGTFGFALPRLAEPVLLLSLVWWLVALIWTFRFPTPIPRAARWLAGAVVLVPLYVALLVLYDVDRLLLLFTLVLVWVADSGAYFAGHALGRVKLAPKISPGKTWEGVIGGLVAVALLAVAWSVWQDIRPAVLVPLCLAVAILSVVGDLTVSMFKRTVGLKDSGKLFPGHGGVLDRIDSIAAATPLFALGSSWVGLR